MAYMLDLVDSWAVGQVSACITTWEQTHSTQGIAILSGSDMTVGSLGENEKARVKGLRAARLRRLSTCRKDALQL